LIANDSIDLAEESLKLLKLILAIVSVIFAIALVINVSSSKSELIEELYCEKQTHKNSKKHLTSFQTKI